MTIRAVLIGLLGAVFVCTFTYFNDAVIHQTYFVGNHMPFSVYGGILLIVLVGLPLLRKMRESWVLSSKELAVILALTLASCCIPSSALLRIFTTTLLLPNRHVKTDTSWQQQKVLSYVPQRMLVDVSQNEDQILGGFVQGFGKAGDPIAISKVPWRAWLPAFSFWIPLLFSMWIAMIGLSLVVHRQWSSHEHLPYPIAQFTRTLLTAREDGGSHLLKHKSFWIGLAGVSLIHINNYAQFWFPDKMVQIPTYMDLTPLVQLFPTFERGGGWYMLAYFSRFYFTAIAIAYLLSSEVAFSVGIAPFVFIWLSGLLAGYGIPFEAGGYLQPSMGRFFKFGAYLGVFFMVFYTGRHYYLRVLQRVFFRGKEDIEASSLWGARVCLIGASLFALQLCVVGLDWPIALLYTFLALMFFLVAGRVIAETGLFFFQPSWFPCMIISGAFGSHALGLSNMVIMFLVTMLVVTDGREILMPYVVNSLKLVDSFQVKIGKVAMLCVVSLLVGLAVGLPVTLYFQYDLGANLSDGWGADGPPRFPFDELVRVRQKLEAQDKLETAGAITGLSRFKEFGSDKVLLFNGLLGLGVALGFSFCRLRFTRWPLHPVMLLVCNSWAGQQFGWSFLIGWFIKIVVMRYGGLKIYQRVTFLMFGLIAGDLIGGSVPFVVGLIYYLATGLNPKAFYGITPG